MIGHLTSRFSRFGSNLVGLLSVHVRLAGLELQDEVARLLCHLVWLLLAVACGTIALILGTLLVVVVFWETHRIAAISWLIAGFLLLCAGLAGGLWIRLKKGPTPFSRLADELELDSKMFHTEQSSSSRE